MIDTYDRLNAGAAYPTAHGLVLPTGGRIFNQEEDEDEPHEDKEYEEEGEDELAEDEDGTEGGKEGKEGGEY